MVDEASPPRKRGRPRKSPEEVSRRPNFSLRVRQEIYDDLIARAQANGRSLSEEVEARLEYDFSDAPANALKSAVSEAVEAARNEEFEEVQSDFGGPLSFHAARSWVESFNAELRKASAGDSSNLGVLSDDKKAAAFAEALCSHIPGLVNQLSGMAKFFGMLEAFTSTNLDKQLQDMKENNPALYEEIERRMMRAAGRLPD